MADEADTGDDFVIHETDGASTSVSEGSMETPKAKGKGDAVPGGTSEGSSAGNDGVKDGGSAGDDAGDDAGKQDSDDSKSGEDDSGDDAGDGEASGEGEGDNEGEGGDSEGDDDATAKAAKKKRSPQDRIAKVTKNWRQEQRSSAAKDERIAELEKRLTDKGAGGKGDDDSSDGDAAAMPKPDDFTYGEADPEYIKALTTHLVKEGVAEVRKTDETTRQEEAARQEGVELQTSYDAKIELGVAAYEDFEEVVVEAAEEGKYPLSQDLALLAIDSDVGHHVLYQIATDLPLAKKIAQMTPVQQAREFGRIEAQHAPGGSAPPKKPNKVPKAPKPPTERKGGKGAKNFNAAEASFEDFEKQVNAEQEANPRRF